MKPKSSLVWSDGGHDDIAKLPLARTPSQSRAKDKVVRALRAAEQLADRDGLGALNLNAVAAAAGISVGSLYQYLPSGEAIAAALVARYHARLEATMDSVIAAAAGQVLDDPVQVVLDAFVTVYREEQGFRVLRDAAGPTVADARAAHKRRMRERQGHLLGVLGVPADRIAGASIIVFAACDAALHEAFAADEPDPVLTELRAFLRSYLAELLTG